VELWVWQEISAYIFMIVRGQLQEQEASFQYLPFRKRYKLNIGVCQGVECKGLLRISGIDAVGGLLDHPIKKLAGRIIMASALAPLFFMMKN
jgi:hypothetical protein